MGLSTSLFFFNKLLQPVLQHIRETLGIQVVLYVNDMLIMAPTCFQAQQVTVKVLELLIGLGWHINKDKCETEPSQIREFLGFLVDTWGEFPMVKVPYHKCCSIGREVQKLLHDSGSGKVPAHQLA